MPKDEYVRNAVVIRIIDGDTIVIDIDLGDDVWRRRTVRLVRINAPELNTEAGKRAASFVATYLPKGTELVVQTTKTHERYGRMLAEVWSRATGRNLNDLLVESGHAVVVG